MSNHEDLPPTAETHREAEVRTRRGLSLVWVVPLAALAIGGWLAYKAFSEKGPVITIDFDSAEGMEAGKTKVKFKDVEVGAVQKINLRPDLSGVTLVVQMNPGAKSFVTDKTRFWVVRAQVSAGQISGLGTLLGGAYIGIDPNTTGARASHFKGLESQPIVTDEPGQYFMLRADSVGSLNVGTPVYYRKIQVGRVVSYKLDDANDTLAVRIFVYAPHDQRVRTSTRFWNASGIDVAVDSSGLRVHTESIVSILSGGIAFETPGVEKNAEPAEADREFTLFRDRQSAFQRVYAKRRAFLAYFDGQQVRGLVPGSDVLLSGIKIGEVTDVRLRYDWERGSFRIPVIVEVEAERIMFDFGGGKEYTPEESLQQVARMVERGLRAQLRSGNLLTGQLVVAIDFHPKEPPAELTFENGMPVMPTVPTLVEELAADVGQVLDRLGKVPFDAIGKDLQTTIRTLNASLGEIRTLIATLEKGPATSVDRILDRIAEVPFESIGGDLQTTMKTLNASLDETRKLVAGFDGKLLPELQTTLKGVQQTLDGLHNSLGTRSDLQLELRRSLTDFGAASRAIRNLADSLERNPESLIKGKEK